MPHEVFICHSAKDRLVAKAVCNRLEASSIRCWVAPRDINPGRDWGEAIIEALDNCKIVVLIFSSEADQSDQVKREIERAGSRGLALLTFRIEDIKPCKSLEFHISNTHWLDAFTSPLEEHLEHLVESVEVLLKRKPRQGVKIDTRSGTGNDSRRDATELAAQVEDVQKSGKKDSFLPGKSKLSYFARNLVLVLMCLGLMFLTITYFSGFWPFNDSPNGEKKSTELETLQNNVPDWVNMGYETYIEEDGSISIYAAGMATPGRTADVLWDSAKVVGTKNIMQIMDMHVKSLFTTYAREAGEFYDEATKDLIRNNEQSFRIVSESFKEDILTIAKYHSEDGKQAHVLMRLDMTDQLMQNMIERSKEEVRKNFIVKAHSDEALAPMDSAVRELGRELSEGPPVPKEIAARLGIGGEDSLDWIKASSGIFVDEDDSRIIYAVGKAQTGRNPAMSASYAKANARQSISRLMTTITRKAFTIYVKNAGDSIDKTAIASIGEDGKAFRAIAENLVVGSIEVANHRSEVDRETYVLLRLDLDDNLLQSLADEAKKAIKENSSFKDLPEKALSKMDDAMAEFKKYLVNIPSVPQEAVDVR